MPIIHRKNEKCSHTWHYLENVQQIDIFVNSSAFMRRIRATKVSFEPREKRSADIFSKKLQAPITLLQLS